jgi:hypothetical protein
MLKSIIAALLCIILVIVPLFLSAIFSNDLLNGETNLFPWAAYGLFISITSIYFIRGYIYDTKKINNIVGITFCLFGYLLTPTILSTQTLIYQDADLIKQGDLSAREKIEMFLKNSQEAKDPQEREKAARGFFKYTGGSLVYKNQENQFVEYAPSKEDEAFWLKNKNDIATEEKLDENKIKGLFNNWLRGLYLSLPLILLLTYLIQIGWKSRKGSKMDKSAEKITNCLWALIIIGFLLITLDKKYDFMTIVPPSISWVFNIAYHILIGFTLAYSLYLLASKKAQNLTHPVCSIVGTLLLIFLGSSVQMAVGSTTSALSQNMVKIGGSLKASDYQKLFDNSNPQKGQRDGSGLSQLIYIFTGTKYPYKPNGQWKKFTPTEDQQSCRDEDLKIEKKVKQTRQGITRLTENAFTNNILLLLIVSPTLGLSLIILRRIGKKINNKYQQS